jgi:hypothetical protein
MGQQQQQELNQQLMKHQESQIALLMKLLSKLFKKKEQEPVAQVTRKSSEKKVVSQVGTGAGKTPGGSLNGLGKTIPFIAGAGVGAAVFLSSQESAVAAEAPRSQVLSSHKDKLLYGSSKGKVEVNLTPQDAQALSDLMNARTGQVIPNGQDLLVKSADGKKLFETDSNGRVTFSVYQQDPRLRNNKEFQQRSGLSDLKATIDYVKQSEKVARSDERVNQQQIREPDFRSQQDRWRQERAASNRLTPSDQHLLKVFNEQISERLDSWGKFSSPSQGITFVKSPEKRGEFAIGYALDDRNSPKMLGFAYFERDGTVTNHQPLEPEMREKVKQCLIQDFKLSAEQLQAPASQKVQRQLEQLSQRIPAISPDSPQAQQINERRGRKSSSQAMSREALISQPEVEQFAQASLTSKPMSLDPSPPGRSAPSSDPDVNAPSVPVNVSVKPNVSAGVEPDLAVAEGIGR